MSSNYYDVLGVDKKSSTEEIKKAYRKKAMEYHPDRAKGDKVVAESKFKEIGEAYDTLSDSSKKKNYDMFGSSKANQFGGGNSYSSSGFGGFEDMFGGSSKKQSSGGFGGFEDLFGGGGNNQQSYMEEEIEEEVSLDFEKTYELPIFDFILGGTVSVKGVYGQEKTIKVPSGTKPGIKMRVKGFGKKEAGEIGNLIIKIEAKMPKYISDIDKSMLERIREGIGY